MNTSASDFTRDELRRYDRQITLPEIGLDGQRRLARASVLLVGAGGLGSPIALYLAAAGVGRIGIIDDDAVERVEPAPAGAPRNLVGRRAKVESAAERMRDLIRSSMSSRSASGSRRGMRCASSPITTSSPTAPTTSPRAISRTTRA